MKKICNFVKNLIIFIYILLIIFVTICLLSYNDYKITVLGDQTLIPIIDENLEPDYTLGDLLIVGRKNYMRIAEGDTVFFYRTFAGGDPTINFAKLLKIERVTDTEYTFTVEGIDGDYRFSSSNYIGNSDTATVIPKVGKVLSILQSKWGFLFLGVFPSLVAFLYTLYSVIAELRGYNEEDDDNDEKPKKKKKKKVVEKEEKQEVEIKETDKTEEKQEKIETEEIKQEVGVKEEDSKEKVEIKEETTKVETKPVENKISDPEKKTLTEEQKKALVEAKLKSMTEEQKKALLQEKLKNMTEEQKRALIEAKKKKLEEQKNK